MSIILTNNILLIFWKDIIIFSTIFTHHCMCQCDLQYYIYSKCNIATCQIYDYSTLWNNTCDRSLVEQTWRRTWTLKTRNSSVTYYSQCQLIHREREILYSLKRTQLNITSLNSQSLKFRDMRTVFSIAHFFSCQTLHPSAMWRQLSKYVFKEIN